MNKAYEKKPYLPGMHGARLKRRINDYSLGLNEKQKLRFMFGLSEKQFHLTFMKAKGMRGVTGEEFCVCSSAAWITLFIYWDLQKQDVRPDNWLDMAMCA